MHSPTEEKNLQLERLKEALLSGRRYYLKRVFLRGALRTMSLALLLFLFALLVEFLIPGNRALEVFFFLLVLFSFLWAFSNFVLFRFLRRPDLEHFAHLLDGALKHRRNTFLSALQLGRTREKLKATSSTQMIERVLENASALATFSRVMAVGKREELRGPGRNVILALIVLVFLFTVFPSKIPGLAMRVLVPSSPENETSILKVLPGDCSIKKGARLDVEALVLGGSGFPMLRFRSGVSPYDAKKMGELPYDGKDGVKRFSVSLGEVVSDLEYEVHFSGKKSKLFGVDVLEPIKPVAFKMKYSPPQYTGLGEEEVRSSSGDISALKGTDVVLDITTNEKCRGGTITFSSNKHLELGKVSPRVLRAGFRVLANESYTLKLEGTGFPYSITALSDNPPLIEIIEPRDDIDLPPEMKFPINFEAADDFGISEVSLLWERENGPGGRVRVSGPSGKGGSSEFMWNLSSVDMLPGDTLAYFLEAKDNDGISGPKIARSERRHVRFPTLGEMFELAQKKQEESRRTLEDVVKEEKELKKFFDETASELKKKGSLSWEEKKSLEKSVEKEKELQEKVKEVSKDIEEVARTLSRRDVIDEKIVGKLYEIRELLQEIGSKELKEALERMNQALSKMDTGQMRRSLDEMKLSREELLKALERTAELLKRIQTEEKIDVAAKMAERLSELQKSLNKRLEEISNEKELSSLLDEQSRIEKQVKELREHLKELASSLKESTPQLSEKLEKMADSMGEKGEIESGLSGMKAGLSMCSGGACKSWGLKLEQSFKELSQGLKSVQSQFGQRMKEELVREMRELGHDLVFLSKKQEEVLSRGPEFTTGDLASEEQASFELTKKASDKLFEISKKTMLVPRELVSEVGNALAKLDDARMSFDAGRKAQGRLRGQEARTSLDRAVVALLRTENSIQSASSSIGMKEAMERLSALTEMQESLNSESENLSLSDQNQGRLKQSIEEEMERLAGEQEMIRKGIEELSGELSRETNLKRSLKKVAEDMKKVVENFEKKEFDESTVERQKKILTRLLDAQKSVRKEDYTRERVSRPGEDKLRDSPPPIPRALLSNEERTRIEILKGRGERFPMRYRALVEKYFESIAVQGK